MYFEYLRSRIRVKSMIIYIYIYFCNYNNKSGIIKEILIFHMMQINA